MLNIKDAPLSDLLRQTNSKDENQVMVLSTYSCLYCPETVRSTGSYIIFYQCGAIYHGTHVTGPVAQSSA